jgi:hypothetical protein
LETPVVAGCSALGTPRTSTSRAWRAMTRSSSSLPRGTPASATARATSIRRYRRRGRHSRVSERFPLIPLRNWLLTPELQWEPRGKRRILPGCKLETPGPARGRAPTRGELKRITEADAVSSAAGSYLQHSCCESDGSARYKPPSLSDTHCVYMVYLTGRDVCVCTGTPEQGRTGGIREHRSSTRWVRWLACIAPGMTVQACATDRSCRLCSRCWRRRMRRWLVLVAGPRPKRSGRSTGDLCHWSLSVRRWCAVIRSDL